MTVRLFDTTLHGGLPAGGILESVADRLALIRLLDGFGFHYIDAGDPGASSTVIELLRQAAALRLRHAKLVVFGEVPRAPDARFRALLDAPAPAKCAVASAWRPHVTDALQTTPTDHVAAVRASIAALKATGSEVGFDADHFFSGHRTDPAFARAVVAAAVEAGASWVTLCDTNGGSLPTHVAAAVRDLRSSLDVPLGVYAQNDGDLAVANTLAAVDAGCSLVRGSINGWGERCGAANLVSVIPALQLKMNRACVTDADLGRLTELSRTASELANVRPRPHQPYVGRSAFSHKGGMHVFAVEKVAHSYEHIPPEQVGNVRHIVVSELSGRGNIRMRADELGIDVHGSERELVERVKELENRGYQFEAAEGSFELLVRRSRPDYVPPFVVVDVVVLSEKRREGSVFAEATVKLQIGDEVVHTVAEGGGPVHALDRAFHKALDDHFPLVSDVHLSDYNVRILDPETATGARTRVLVEAARGDDRWRTIGVSANIIEASVLALADALELPLARERRGAPPPAAGPSMVARSS